MGLLGVWRLAHYRCEKVSALKGREREEDSSSVLTEAVVSSTSRNLETGFLERCFSSFHLQPQRLGVPRLVYHRNYPSCCFHSLERFAGIDVKI